MPNFFAYTKNGRREDGTPIEKCAPRNDSVMNKICAHFDKGKVKNIKFNFEEVPNFNYKMFLKDSDCSSDLNVIEAFELGCDAVRSMYLVNILTTEFDEVLETSVNSKEKARMLYENLKSQLINVFGFDKAYRSIVVHLFSRIDKSKNKEAFWEMFGDEAYEILKTNLGSCHKCEAEGCGMLVPNWDEHHAHQGEDSMHGICINCGKTFEKTGKNDVCCKECAAERKKAQIRQFVSLDQKKRAERRKCSRCR